MQHAEITEQIIGCSYRVFNTLGSGFLKSVYEKSLLLELKAAEEITKAHEVQLVNYLTATGKSIGLLINFSPNGVVVRRKVRDLSEISS